MKPDPRAPIRIMRCARCPSDSFKIGTQRSKDEFWVLLRCVSCGLVQAMPPSAFAEAVMGPGSYQ